MSKFENESFVIEVKPKSVKQDDSGVLDMLIGVVFLFGVIGTQGLSTMLYSFMQYLN